MRIGILSFPFGTNYGGTLQSYALQQTLIKYGHTIEIIRYKDTPEGKLQHVINTYRSSSSIFDFIQRLIGRIKYIRKHHKSSSQKKWEAFDAFRAKYFKPSPLLNSSTIGDYANKNYDAIIVGSDQVWTNLASNDRAYFIDWEPNFNGLRISYAACSAHSSTSNATKKKLRKLLNRFNTITVRDKTTFKLVKHITSQEPLIVPDPTLLYDFSEFTSNRKEEKYVLTYILGSEIKGGHEKAIKKIWNLLGDKSKIKIIDTEACDENLKNIATEVLSDISPEEWVNYFANASAIYTDSFHAVLFAMKFNIPFVAYYRDKIRKSRMIDLQNRYDLQIITDASDITRLNHRSIALEQLDKYIPFLTTSY